MDINNTENYLAEREASLYKKISKRIKTAYIAFGFAAFAILVFPFFTAVPGGYNVSGYVERTNWWAAGFAVAAMIYTIVEYIMFDNVNRYAYSPRFLGPVTVAFIAVLIFGGIWVFTGNDMAREYVETKWILKSEAHHFRLNLFGPITYIAAMVLGSVLLIYGVHNSLDELAQVEDLSNKE